MDNRQLGSAQNGEILRVRIPPRVLPGRAIAYWGNLADPLGSERGIIRVMKYCPKCDTRKPRSDFAKHANRSDGLQSLCKECKRALDKSRYSRDPSTYLARNIKLRNKLREVIALAKHVPCKDCGKSYPSYVMDFDHLPEFTKKFSIATSVATAKSVRALQEEIGKCEVVCSNCHRVRTWQRRQCPVV